mgnify:CR=1 FL=1
MIERQIKQLLRKFMEKKQFYKKTFNKVSVYDNYIILKSII